MENAIETFRGSVVKITTEGKQHLGATIRSEDFKASYVKSLVDNWHNDLGDITANVLSHVCNNVEIKPKLLPLLVKVFRIEQRIHVLKQDLIPDQGGSGFGVNKHSLM